MERFASILFLCESKELACAAWNGRPKHEEFPIQRLECAAVRASWQTTPGLQRVSLRRLVAGGSVPCDFILNSNRVGPDARQQRAWVPSQPAIFRRLVRKLFRIKL